MRGRAGGFRLFGAIVGATAGVTAGAGECPERLFSDSFEAGTVPERTILLSVSGLGASRTATFRLNDAESVTAFGDGRLCFVTRLPDGSAYEVQVETQPASGPVCRLDRGVGTVLGPLQLQVDCTLVESLWDEMNWGEDWG